ncbi:MAG TPA: DUF3598 family protein [Leptolyngbyaceae cyanobacterium]
MASQWERLLKNSGTWIGSFTHFSPDGQQISDTPTEISLKPEGDLMRQEIRKMPLGETPQETVLEYRSLGKGVLFCEGGAFSQGSIQWSPFGDFGAELGFIHGTERLRLVELFKGERTLSSLTLIREHLEGTQPQSRPLTSVDQLIGTWQGQAVTVYPDLQPEDTYATQLEIQREGSDRIHQTLQFGQAPPIQTEGKLLNNQLQFDQGIQPVTLLLLPGGASATYPTHIESGKPLFLEAGWLISPTLRQRLIRSYNAQGTWMSLTLVVEQKTP